jgi:ketosteroid isomerase-like protein
MHRMRLGIALVFLAGISFALPACQQKQQPAPQPIDTRAADEAAIRNASLEWSQAAQAKDLTKCVSYYAEDAQVFPPGGPLVTGADAIRATWGGLLSAPGPGLSFSSTKAEASRGGDLAYESGVYEFTTLDKHGHPNIEKGKYVVVWKKQPDGSWKAIADIWNADK